MKTIKILFIFLGLFLIAVVLVGVFFHGDTLTPAQKKQVEGIVHDYLMRNPEVLMEVSKALQEKQANERIEKVKAAARKNIALLLDSTNVPLLGNSEGDVTLVEFFDYQCGHCRTMSTVIDGLVKKNPNLRVLFREFPILGKRSMLASRVALAAYLQGKYVVLHRALMASKKPLDDEQVMTLAKEVGLDVDKLAGDKEKSERITKMVQDNYALAKTLNLDATPIFIVIKKGVSDNDYQVLVRFGSISQEKLQEMISIVIPANAGIQKGKG